MYGSIFRTNYADKNTESFGEITMFEVSGKKSSHQLTIE